MSRQPNIVIIMTDQQRADISAREGFPLDTTPSLDNLARQGTWFNRAHTVMPACLPARVSMLTGRFPSATKARTNHNGPDAVYETDLIDVLTDQGYSTGLCGKNHSHLSADRLDYWFELGHSGQYTPYLSLEEQEQNNDSRTNQEKAFDEYLYSLEHRAAMEPSPFPLETQCPYRAVSAAMDWIDTLEAQPFFLWLSFPEPHNPYQVPEPYYSMFPPESLPPNRADKRALDGKGFKFQWTRQIGEVAFPDYEEQLPRARANYLGMLRLIDDQVKRFVDYLEVKGLRDDTILIVLSDHGDFVGEYGLMRKGPELPEVLSRIPFVVTGPGIQQLTEPHPAHISLFDIMPTLCDMLGVEIPHGVQGRSLWPLLSGQEYPDEEFASIYVEHGFGGLHYTPDDNFDPTKDGLTPGVRFDELNGWSQSGKKRMIRRGEWKLVFDMQGNGQLYNLEEDPIELFNLFGTPACVQIERQLLADLLAWTLRVQDPLPYPRIRYQFKRDSRNYWTPHQQR